MMTKSKIEKQRSLYLKDNLMIFVGLLVSLIIILVLLININLDLVWKTIKKIPSLIIIGSVCAITLSSLLRSKAWQVILDKRISYLRSFKSVNEGQMLNTFLPLRLGDLARAFFTSNKSELQFLDIFTTIVIERVYDVLIMLMLLSISLPFILIEVQITNSIIFSLLFIVTVIFLICVLILIPEKLQKIWNFLFKLFPSFNKWGGDKILEVSNSLQILRNGKKFLQITFWMILTWVFALFSIWILLKGFFSDVNIVMPIFLQGVSGLGVSVPSSPGSIGVYEATMGFGLSAFGIDESIAFAFGLLHHFLSILPVVVIGIISLILDGQSLIGWFSKLRSLRKVK